MKNSRVFSKRCFTSLRIHLSRKKGFGPWAVLAIMWPTGNLPICPHPSMGEHQIPLDKNFYRNKNYFIIVEVIKKKWLISWIGNADHQASVEASSSNSGPIATALLNGERFDRVCLLTNYGHNRSSAYCSWLESQCNYDSLAVDLQEVTLRSPIDYASIYAEVAKHLKDLGLPREGIELTFHLSPGTPAMAAIWIMLAKTRFPARLIQTSREHGLEAVDFPFDLASDFLPEFLQRSAERIERLSQGPQESSPQFSKILHCSEAVRQQVKLARRIAAHDVPVLILGETGTGKELFAEAICAASERAEKPFIAVNCGAIAPELANSELFGHVKGAFTGAITARKGHFQEAHGGTLFLDEVGDLPLETQVRLLRVLQSKEVTPLGDSKAIKIDVRIVAATHRDLVADIAAGRFREDLFHRLAVGILRLPPLRARDDDVNLLAAAFLSQINADAKGRPEAQEKRFSENAKKLLRLHSWPGNIRELYHTVLRAVIWSAGPVIEGEDLQAALLPIQPANSDLDGRTMAQGFDLQELLDEMARGHILRALQETGNRKTAAAKILGFSNHQTLGNWMKRLGLETQD
ncbi:RNA repair transcriptional activator RtcR family protein [Herbaspirillum lusitanum]|uniref:RNA repair transcriptional activator RtcR family protein n=1 Tax=Herbaspirillum lusitanum TaxID=213312 RepID=A0ABW9AAN3_9BURK